MEETHRARWQALGPDELERVRGWLERERERKTHRLLRLEQASAEFRERVAARDPCVYLSPTAAAEDAEQVARLQRTGSGTAELREIEAALRRLAEDPQSFGRCERCSEVIPLARLEVIPQTRLCGVCAGKAEISTPHPPNR